MFKAFQLYTNFRKLKKMPILVEISEKKNTSILVKIIEKSQFQ